MTDIPRARDLMHFSVLEAALKRWEWGERCIPASERLETGGRDRDGVPRDELLELYEEQLDAINFATHGLQTCERDDAAEFSCILADQALVAERTRRLCLRRHPELAPPPRRT